MIKTDVVIIGAGAAGLMCAIAAAQRGRKVIVLDHAEKPGKKILISGGGRCNFSNLDITAEQYISANPHFCKSALTRFTVYDFLAMMEKHQLTYEEKKLGQLFCRQKSQGILNMLLTECKVNQVAIILNQHGLKITKHPQCFSIDTKIQTYQTESLVIASGGKSIKKMGASDFGYQLAEQFDIPIVETQPGLVPLLVNQQDASIIQGLSGISLDASVSCANQSFRENILLTHKGLSGPAILQISNYWQPGDTINIDCLPEIDLLNQLQIWQDSDPDKTLKTLLTQKLSKRLVHHWVNRFLKNQPIKQYSFKDLENIADFFQNWKITPLDTQGYKKAEVTRGGVDTRAISSKTFACKKVVNLYFIGEVLDVTGWLGGYNFQWAWSSGYCAGQYV